MEIQDKRKRRINALFLEVVVNLSVVPNELRVSLEEGQLSMDVRIFLHNE